MNPFPLAAANPNRVYIDQRSWKGTTATRKQLPSTCPFGMVHELIMFWTPIATSELDSLSSSDMERTWSQYSLPEGRNGFNVAGGIGSCYNCVARSAEDNILAVDGARRGSKVAQKGYAGCSIVDWGGLPGIVLTSGINALGQRCVLVSSTDGF